MTPRKPITDKMKWEALLFRFEIPCICGERIDICKDVIEWHHVWEVADQGPHNFTNIRPVHKECHKLLSAKAEAQRHHINRLEKEKNGEPKRKRPKRNWPKRKMRAAA